MLSQEKNDLITRTGPGTPAGALLRRYWQPVALSEELPGGEAREPRPVQIMGEDLVLYRQDDGQPALLGRRCPHRGTDLSYGRLEDGGLRCLYHGWLFNGQGRCLETPAAPPDSTFHTRVRHPAYPCREAGGMIFAYMGGGEPPELPMYEVMRAPAEHRWATKIKQRCNYLQSLEGDVDPAHTSFLHRFLGEKDTSRTVGKEGKHPWDLFMADENPTISTEETRFGLRIFATRKIGGEQEFFRVTNFLMPNVSVVPGTTGEDGYTLNWNVPIDDTSAWRYKIEFRRSQPLVSGARRERFAREFRDYVPIRSEENRYRQDRAQMDEAWFAGMDELFPIHDTFAVESQGAIVDRTVEQLAPTDRAIIAMRRLLFTGIDVAAAGEDPLNVVRDPAEAAYHDVVVMSDVVDEGADPNAVVEKVREEVVRF